MNNIMKMATLFVRGGEGERGGGGLGDDDDDGFSMGSIFNCFLEGEEALLGGIAKKLKFFFLSHAW